MVRKFGRVIPTSLIKDDNKNRRDFGITRLRQTVGELTRPVAFKRLFDFQVKLVRSRS